MCAIIKHTLASQSHSVDKIVKAIQFLLHKSFEFMFFPYIAEIMIKRFHGPYLRASRYFSLQLTPPKISNILPGSPCINWTNGADFRSSSRYVSKSLLTIEFLGNGIEITCRSFLYPLCWVLTLDYPDGLVAIRICSYMWAFSPQTWRRSSLLADLK